MGMGEECFKCKLKINNNAIHCNGICQKGFHPECMKITNDEARLVSKNKNIRWFCDNCTVIFEKFYEIKLEIDGFKSEINAKIESICKAVNSSSNANIASSNNINSRKSYAEAAGEVVIVKPKKTQESKVTKEVIKKTLNPTKLEVGITQIKDIKEGGILIKCKSKEEVKKIKTEVEKKLKKNYDIKTPELKNPHIKIVDLEEDIDAEILENCILKQNVFLNKESFLLKVKTVKKMKSKYMAIVECDPLTMKLILEQGKISIGWSICRVYEYIPVFRCYKCGDYDHKAESCKREERCLKCASVDHKTIDCLSDDYKCCNCTQANLKFKLNLNVEHTTFDVKCPVYLRKIQSLKQRIKASENT